MLDDDDVVALVPRRGHDQRPVAGSSVGAIDGPSIATRDGR